MAKRTKTPINLQQVREARSAEVVAAVTTEKNATLAAVDQAPQGDAAVEVAPDPEETAQAQDAAELAQMGAVQVSMEEVFQIIGAQEYELRALRQRVPMLVQQVVTLKGVIRRLEGPAKKV